MTKHFNNELLQTGYIHRLLAPDKSRASEARLLQKKVLKSRSLCENDTPWEASSEGEMKIAQSMLSITIPARKEYNEPMPPYWGYCMMQATLSFPQGDDWRGYNRLRCKIKPRRNGLHAQVATMYLTNDGEIKIPDRYDREGAFWVNLDNDQWNDVIWEFPDLSRDKITSFSFDITAFGQEKGSAENLEFIIKDIFLEEVENPDISLGWQGNPETVCYSSSGYFANGRKQAIVSFGEGSFDLINESGEVKYTGSIEKVTNEKGAFGLLDFSAYTTPGHYRLRINDQTTTQSFTLSENPYDEAVWKALNFIYAERCGFPVNGGHGFCHGDYIAEHDGKKIIFCGGWHDAADLSQQTLQTAEVAHALYECALNTNELQLYNRLIEEANWGLDFVLRTRFGDGFRATGLGCCRWTDQYIGSNDDEKAMVHNRSFDNFLMGGVEAYAAFALQNYDPDKSYVALKAAKEDFAFALQRFNEIGCETGPMMEHTYNAAEAQYYAAASWCASNIFKACSETYYADQAANFGELLLECQDNGETGTDFTGFFYRDKSKKVITHFNHQSREHIFAQALAALCETQPQSTALPTWKEGLRRYGEYLKAVFHYAAPYGMFPAGLHAYNEAEDAATFQFLHVRTNFNEEKDNYLKQLKSGIPVNDNYCIKQFPVWFSFRGNSAVILSSGKAASITGRILGDASLIEIARDQLYWHSGKNPFGQSLMYGEGHNYPQQYALLLGETVGEMPVGIQTKENEDVPYWPMANQATYKEVWMSTVGHWLWVMADML